MNFLKYYLRDAKEGIYTNKTASFTTVLLITILLTFVGSSLLVKSSVDHVVTFLNSQVNLKVFVQDGVDVEEVKNILEKSQYISSAKIEKGEEVLERMSEVFQERGQQFNLFKPVDFPDSINIQLVSNDYASTVADELPNIGGIANVIYPQHYAEKMLEWSKVLSNYGYSIIFIFTVVAVFSIASTINLGLLQRKKEIHIKMLLGANPNHVRGQFLFEGWLLSVVGALFSCGLLLLINNTILYRLYANFDFIFIRDTGTFYSILFLIFIFGTVVGLLGAYLSTRSLIKNA